MIDKFEKGETVYITEGVDKGNIAVINSISSRNDQVGRDTIYEVCTLDHPEGILVNESKLDIFLDSHVPLLEDAAEKSHIFCEMAAIGGGFCNIKLGIFDNEGTIPHFHFFKGIKPEGGVPKSARHTGGCICFNSAEYFIHGKHTETLTKEEIDGLNQFLRSRSKSIPSVSNWLYMIGLWNDNNPYQTQLDTDIEIPYYTHNMPSNNDTSMRQLRYGGAKKLY